MANPEGGVVGGCRPFSTSQPSIARYTLEPGRARRARSWIPHLTASVALLGVFVTWGRWASIGSGSLFGGTAGRWEALGRWGGPQAAKRSYLIAGFLGLPASGIPSRDPSNKERG